MYTHIKTTYRGSKCLSSAVYTEPNSYHPTEFCSEISALLMKCIFIHIAYSNSEEFY